MNKINHDRLARAIERAFNIPEWLKPRNTEVETPEEEKKMNKNEYIEYLKAKGIYKYVTEFVPSSCFLINKITGKVKYLPAPERTPNNNKNVNVKTVSLDSEQMKDVDEYFSKYDKCHFLFNKYTEECARENKIRFYGWKREFECTLKIPHHTMQDLVGLTEVRHGEQEREANRLNAIHRIGNLVMIEYSKSIRKDGDILKDIKQLIEISQKNPVATNVPDFIKILKDIMGETDVEYA